MADHPTYPPDRYIDPNPAFPNSPTTPNPSVNYDNAPRWTDEDTRHLLTIIDRGQVDYPEDLELLPHGTILIDRQGHAWQRLSRADPNFPHQSSEHGFSCTNPSKNVDGPGAYLPALLILPNILLASSLKTAGPKRTPTTDGNNPLSARSYAIASNDPYIQKHRKTPSKTIIVRYFWKNPRSGHMHKAMLFFLMEHLEHAVAFSEEVGGEMRDLATGYKIEMPGPMTPPSKDER